MWTVSRLHRQQAERKNHPTQKPLTIVERMVKASCPKLGIVLDPFAGSGTTVAACLLNQHHYVAFELNSDYHRTILNRVEQYKNRRISSDASG